MFRRILNGLLILLGVWFVWREFEPLLLFRRVDGHVLASGVFENGELHRRPMSHPRSRRTQYVPDVLYRYEVGGSRYVSVQFRRTNLGRTRSGAAREARSYMVGSIVSAWYSPFNPADSVLRRDPNLILLGMVGFVGLFVWAFSWLAVNGRPAGRPPGERH